MWATDHRHTLRLRTGSCRELFLVLLKDSPKHIHKVSPCFLQRKVAVDLELLYFCAWKHELLLHLNKDEEQTVYYCVLPLSHSSHFKPHIKSRPQTHCSRSFYKAKTCPFPLYILYFSIRDVHFVHFDKNLNILKNWCFCHHLKNLCTQCWHWWLKYHLKYYHNNKFNKITNICL